MSYKKSSYIDLISSFYYLQSKYLTYKVQIKYVFDQSEHPEKEKLLNRYQVFRPYNNSCFLLQLPEEAELSGKPEHDNIQNISLAATFRNIVPCLLLATTAHISYTS